MAAAPRTFAASFAGGEVTPELWGRIDDAKFGAGAATMRNFIALPHGPAMSRAGLRFVRNAGAQGVVAPRLIPFSFSATQTLVLEFGGGYVRMHTQGATVLGVDGYPFYIETPYLSEHIFDLHYVQSGDVMTLTHPAYAPRELRRLSATNWELRTILDAAPLTSGPEILQIIVTRPGGAGPGYAYYYAITAITADGLESPRTAGSAFNGNNLAETGATNTVSWVEYPNAVRYNVYRRSGGVYGFIGTTETLSFVDDNITPDVSRTPPVYETPFNGANNRPAAVGYFEQRRVFAGSTNRPQHVWMTATGTEAAFSRSLPVRDDDRVVFRVASRQADAIRHIVPMGDLLLLTGASEWRVSASDGAALTPSNIRARPQSYVGANNVQPLVVNNAVLFAAERGGHVREMAYSEQANGYLTGDLCLRAAHLFDGMTIVDAAQQKAPWPICWFVSSSGKLLGLTYIPEQQVWAWHQHDTAGGEVKSVCVVAEGKEDAVYVVARRKLAGISTTTIERMASRVFAEPADAFFVDCGLTYDGRLTYTANRGQFSYLVAILTPTPLGLQAGNTVSMRLRGGPVTPRVLAGATPLAITVILSREEGDALFEDGAVTVGPVEVLTSRVSGLTHLEGETVSILADGAVQPSQVVTGGAVTLDAPSTVVHAGLPIQADLKTLPLAAQLDGAYGQGRMKNINRAWLRVHRSGAFWIGPDAEHLTEAKVRRTEPPGSPPALKTEDVEVMLTPTWQQLGQVFVRQAVPLPLTVVGLALEIAPGG